MSIAEFLGTKHIDFTVPSLTGLGDRHYADVEDLQDEVGNARIWGGIHYRSAVEDGIEIGKRTAHQVLAHHFQKSSSKAAAGCGSTRSVRSPSRSRTPDGRSTKMTLITSLGSGRLLTLLAMAVTLCPSTLAHATVTAANGEAPFKAHLYRHSHIHQPDDRGVSRSGARDAPRPDPERGRGGVCPMRGLDARRIVAGGCRVAVGGACCRPVTGVKRAVATMSRGTESNEQEEEA